MIHCVTLALAMGLLGADGGPFSLDDGGAAHDAGFETYGCPDAPLAYEVDGGVFMPSERAAREACIKAGCQKELQLVKAEDAKGPGAGPIAIASAAGFLAGVIAALVTVLALKR